MLPSIKPFPLWLSGKNFLVAFAFGAGAMLILLSQTAIPIPGTQFVTDPREMAVTIGSALTGPAGGILIGLMAGMLEVSHNIRLASMLSHGLAGLWIGISYKLLVYNHPRLPLPIGWTGLLVAYYFLLIVPGAILFIYPNQALYTQVFGASVPPPRAYMMLASAAVPEMLVTTLITLLILYALSKRYRRPLW